MQQQHLLDLPTHLSHRVEGGQRILEHHRDLGTAHAAQLVLAEVEQVSPAVTDLAAEVGAAAAAEAQYRQGGDALARARFAHQGNDLAGAQLEIDPVHRPQGPIVSVECDLEAVDRKRWFGAHRLILGSRKVYSSSVSALMIT